jgi:hypothetical protein
MMISWVRYKVNSAIYYTTIQLHGGRHEKYPLVELVPNPKKAGVRLPQLNLALR